MCFFPHINTDFTGEAFRAGVKEFGCGYCPECLQKRSRSWVVRAFYERETSGSCMMLTLTYDHFKRDKNGNILRDRLGYPLEEPVAKDMPVGAEKEKEVPRRLPVTGDF